jgi:hypothetical protein
MTAHPQSFYFGICQNRGHDVENGDGWHCTLCNRSLVSERDRTLHVNAEFHKGHVLDFARTMNYASSALARRTKTEALECRLTELKHTKWQFHVKALLFDYLSSTGDYNILQKVETSLSMYEHMERLSLLELAVWKAACLSQVEIDSKTSMKTFHDAILCVAKHQHNWKKYRTETRKSNAIEIIVKHVLPFLDKP